MFGFLSLTQLWCWTQPSYLYKCRFPHSERDIDLTEFVLRDGASKRRTGQFCRTALWTKRETERKKYTWIKDLDGRPRVCYQSFRKSTLGLYKNRMLYKTVRYVELWCKIQDWDILIKCYNIIQYFMGTNGVLETWSNIESLYILFLILYFL